MTINKKTKISYLPFIVISLSGIFLLYEFALQVLPSVITQELMSTFKVGALTLGTAMAMYYYSYAPTQLFAGLSFDRFGARKTLTVAIVFCAVGTALLAYAPNVYVAGLGRFLTGLGSAFSFVGMLFLGKRWFAAKYFYIIVSATEFMGAMGAVVGQYPVAASVAGIGWRPTLTILSVFGLVLTVAVWFFIRDFPEDHPDKEEFLSNQLHSMKVRLGYIIKNSQLWAIGLHAFMVFAPVTAFAALWGVPFLVANNHISTAVAGAACSMIWVGMALGTPVVCWASDRFNNRKVPLALSASLGIIVTSIILFSADLNLTTLFVLLFLFGAATSGQAMSFLVVSDITPVPVIGTAMGFNNLLIVATGAIFQPLVGGILDLVWDGRIVNHVHYYTAANYKVALSLIPVCFFVALLICIFWLKETHGRFKPTKDLELAS